MELLKCVYFCTQKSIIKAGNNKFQDLINVPRIPPYNPLLYCETGMYTFVSYFCSKT